MDLSEIMEMLDTIKKATTGNDTVVQIINETMGIIYSELF